MACHWVRDKDVPGGKYWVPECYGGIYDPSGCYCPKSPRAPKDELQAKIDALTKRIEALEAMSAMLPRSKTDD